MKTIAAVATFAAAVLMAPALSLAALPTGALTFMAPTGTAVSTDIIELRMRFTLDAASTDLTFSSDPLTGFAPTDLPVQGTYVDPVTGAYSLRDFASINRAFLNTTYYCNDTFVDVCAPSANYSFEFWTVSQPGKPSINFLDSFSLPAGASTEYVFGRYLPAAGGATPGSYIFYNTTLDLIFEGVDATGNALSYQHTLGQSCENFTPDCAFTRTVTAAVPEPGSFAMLALGLVGMGLRLRRRRD
jgi:hypothetical protein